MRGEPKGKKASGAPRGLKSGFSDRGEWEGRVNWVSSGGVA